MHCLTGLVLQMPPHTCRGLNSWNVMASALLADTQAIIASASGVARAKPPPGPYMERGGGGLCVAQVLEGGHLRALLLCALGILGHSGQLVWGVGNRLWGRACASVQVELRQCEQQLADVLLQR